MTEEEKKEVTADGREAHEKCVERQEEILRVLESHARLLEKHGLSIDKITRGMKTITDGVEAVRSAQLQMNQTMADIHQMWAKLECNRPDGSPRRTPSSELRAVVGKLTKEE